MTSPDRHKNSSLATLPTRLAIVMLSLVGITVATAAGPTSGPSRGGGAKPASQPTQRPDAPASATRPAATGTTATTRETTALEAAVAWRDARVKKLQEDVKAITAAEGKALGEARNAALGAQSIKSIKASHEQRRSPIVKRLAALRALDGQALLDEHQSVLEQRQALAGARKEADEQDAADKQLFAERSASARQRFNWTGALDYCPNCVVPKYQGWISALGEQNGNDAASLGGARVTKVPPIWKAPPDRGCTTCGGTGLVPTK